MSLSKAIKKQDFKKLTEAVEAAVAVYGAGMPTTEPKVETAYGQVPVSMLIDEDSKWATVTAEYVAITDAVTAIPKKADRKIEIAKLIANNAVLRCIVSESSASNGEGLL